MRLSSRRKPRRLSTEWMPMSQSQLRLTSFVMAVALAIFVASFVTDAQTPAPGAPAQPQVGQGTAPGAPDPAGRAGGRGRGGAETLAGGPQLDDPAYANYDFS